jgi:hypothetical protein
MAGKLVRAKETFAVDHEGEQLVVHAGALVAASHPIVKGHADLFEPAEPRPGIEAPAKKARAKRSRKRT